MKTIKKLLSYLSTDKIREREAYEDYMRTEWKIANPRGFNIEGYRGQM